MGKGYALRQGDCLEVMASLPTGIVDMVMTDPPYGTTACKWDSVIPLEPMWVQLKRLVKPNAAIVMTAGQPFTSALVMSNPEMFKYCWVWEKNKASGHLNAKKQPMKAHEDVCVFYKKQPIYNPDKTTGHAPMNYAMRTTHTECYGAQTPTASEAGTTKRYPRTVQQFAVVNNDATDRLHPTQKPVALMEYLIKTYTNEGQVVLDFTTGSGTTGVACVNTGRKFIGIEKDDTYFKVASDRIELAYAQAMEG